MNYSFVVPIYKDAALAEAFCQEFARVFREYCGRTDIEKEVEVIFVNDGSSDNSDEILRQTCQRHRFARAMSLSRNFGQHIALSCGYAHARGRFVGSLNVDMQDPPAEIPRMLARFEEDDVDIVLGLRRARRSSRMDQVTSKLFHYVLSKLTGYDLPLNMATLRVMNRRFVDAYNALTEKSRFIPGLEYWLGFKRAYVPVEHVERQEGRSSYTFRKRFLMALDSIISFSDLPLKITVVAGSLIALLGLLLGVLLMIQKLFFVTMLPGYTSTVCLIVFFGGVQILSIGLASLYIGRILKEVQNRPLYIIRTRHNFQNDTAEASRAEHRSSAEAVVSHL